MHPTLSFRDLAFLGRVGSSRIKDLFDQNTVAANVPSSIFTFGSGWATNGLLPTPYVAVQAREYFDDYADASGVSGSALNTGTGWATDTLLPSSFVGVIASQTFDSLTADTAVSSTVVTDGTGWATDPAPMTQVASVTFTAYFLTIPGNVTLSCATSGASIYYTVDGSTPTTASTLYSSPFSVSVDPTLVKAIAVKTGYRDSAVTSQPYGKIPSLFTGLKVWLKADAITGKNDGDALSQWDDSSGQANHATQSTGSLQPLYKTSILNSNPVVRFDTTDGMTVPYTVALPTTIMMVVDYRSATSAARRAMQGAVNNWLLGPYLNTWRFYNGAFITGPAVTQNVFVLLEVTQVTGVATFLVGGSTIGTNNSNTVVGAIRLGATGGAAEPLDGDIAEVLVYDNALSSSDRTNLRSYVLAKYGI